MPFIKGDTRINRTGKKKADKSVLVDLWEETGFKIFEEAVRAKKEWAIKLLVNKLFSDPKEIIGAGDNGEIILKISKEIAEKNETDTSASNNS